MAASMHAHHILILKDTECKDQEVVNGPYNILITTEQVEAAAAYEKHVYTKARINISNFATYMRWKFERFSLDSRATILTADLFEVKRVDAPLAWIINIINTELDYHLGNKDCLRPENKQYLTIYKRYVWSGFGPRFTKPFASAKNKT